MNRCEWALTSPELQNYHDHEWGVPVYDDQRLFEFLVLEGAQAGLSWSTILKKREGYRAAFDHFEVARVAAYDEAKINALIENPAIVRNRLKIRSAVTNAQAFLRVQQEFSSFADYIWRFVDGKSIQNTWQHYRDAPARTPVSDALSKDLKKRGFNFVGSTICYAHMQATGMVNDHCVDCFRHPQLNNSI